MKVVYRKFIFATLTFCLIACAIVAFLPQMIGAKANMVNKIQGFTVEQGAYIRNKEPMGIRFTVSITKSAYESVVSGKEKVEFGVLISKGNFTSSEQAERFLIDNIDNTFMPLSVWDKTENPNNIETEKYVYKVSVYGIDQENYNKSYTVLGCVKVDGEIFYSNITGDCDNIRSPFQVAVAHKTNADEMGEEASFINGIINKVMTASSTPSLAFDKNVYQTTLDSQIELETTVDGQPVKPIYTFENEKVAKVVGGKITAVGAGQTKVTATINDGTTDYTATATIKVSSPLLVNGESQYKVVIPASASEWEEFAAEELTLFFKQATGEKLQVVADTGLTFSESDKYISIGNTTLYRGSGVTADYGELGRDGYKIVTKGSTVILAGGGGYGNINAVYGFLNAQVDYKAYAPDELYVKEVTDLNLIDFNLTDIPDFETRAGGYYVTFKDKTFATRSRTLASYDTRLFQNKAFWGSWAHNHLGYLPPETYYENNKDWYYVVNGEPVQLCLSNTAMRDEMVSEVKKQILRMPDSELFMVGQMDNHYFCDCKTCSARVTEIKESGLMMEFINYVAEKIATWQRTACPNREIYICTFAYYNTQEAPVKKNESGNLVPISSSVVARDNVRVMVAPISSDFSKPFTDIEHNASSAKMIEEWPIVAKDKILVWSYCNNFSQTLEYFDNIDVIATNYQAFRDIGTKFLFDESSGSLQYAFAFQTMMAYVHSELMWDCDQDVDDLIDDFMHKYYKEAYQPIRNYYDCIKTFVAQRKIELGEQDGTYYGTPLYGSDVLQKPRFWDKTILEEMLGYFEQAYEIIEQTYTGEEKGKMLDRLKVESLTPRMYLINSFKSSYSNAEYMKLVSEFASDAKRLGVKYVFRDNKTLEKDISIWLGGLTDDNLLSDGSVPTV